MQNKLFILDIEKTTCDYPLEVKTSNSGLESCGALPDSRRLTPLADR